VTLLGFGTVIREQCVSTKEGSGRGVAARLAQRSDWAGGEQSVPIVDALHSLS
jgi:hypothetical protein